jgi:hypothetical protein
MGTPVFGTNNPLTYTELHAAILGAVVGVLVGYGHVIGRTGLATGFTAFFVAVALGVQYHGKIPKAQKTIRREPWYALAALLVGGAVAVALFGGGTAMVV